MHWAPFLLVPPYRRDAPYAGAVEAQGLDPDPDHLLPLQVLEHAIQDALLRPPVHARVDGVPVAETLRQAAPLAAVLGHVENGMGTCRFERPAWPRCLGSSGAMRPYCSGVSSTCLFLRIVSTENTGSKCTTFMAMLAPSPRKAWPALLAYNRANNDKPHWKFSCRLEKP